MTLSIIQIFPCYHKIPEAGGLYKEAYFGLDTGNKKSGDPAGNGLPGRILRSITQQETDSTHVCATNFSPIAYKDPRIQS